MNFSLLIALIAALGGFLFGYNSSVISGAMLFMGKDLALTTFQEELVVSTLLIGALLGALLSGYLTDAFGRKKTLLIGAVFFFAGTLILSDAGAFHLLISGRFITGVAIGLASVAVPLYLAEIAPHTKRGFFVSLNQLMITIGVFAAYVVCYLLAAKEGWREMFGLGLVPLALQCIGLLFIPETPAWLLSHGKTAAAEKVLERLHKSRSKDPIVQEKQGDLPHSKGWSALFQPGMRKAFFIGIGVSVFQQITGINTVIYYAPRIFQLAGYQSAESATFATMLLGVVNVAMTLVALKLIDRLGRRPLLIIGLIGMALSLTLLGGTFLAAQGEAGIFSVIALMAYISFFAISLGPVAWLIISEIYPLGIRGRAMGVATFANWASNYLVSLTFLSLLHAMGPSMTFWLYTVIALIGLWFVYKMVPETKGKTFEQIQQFWKNS